jgi:CheY-like chemotaxis protein
MAALILIAEDHADSLTLMGYLLQAHGYRVLTAEDGEVALELTIRAHPDLILCDLQMPKINGYEVARQLKGDALLQRTPLVAVTACSMAGDREKVLAAGFDGYFAKPIDVERFVAELEHYIPAPLRAPPRSGAGDGV